MGKIYDLMYRGFFFSRVLIIREIRVSTVIIVKETIFLSVPFILEYTLITLVVRSSMEFLHILLILNFQCS